MWATSRATLVRVIAAGLAACTILAVGGAPTARAAPPDLRVVGDATYEVRPADRVVHVVVEGSATSYKADSGGSTYYFTAIQLVIFSGATDLVASAGGRRAGVSVIDAADQQQLIEVQLNRASSTTRRQRSGWSTTSRPARRTARCASGRTSLGSPSGRSAPPRRRAAASRSRSRPASSSTWPAMTLPDPESRSDGGRVYSWTAIPDPDAFWLFATADLATITDSTYRDYTSHVNGARPPGRGRGACLGR